MRDLAKINKARLSQMNLRIQVSLKVREELIVMLIFRKITFLINYYRRVILKKKSILEKYLIAAKCVA